MYREHTCSRHNELVGATRSIAHAPTSVGEIESRPNDRPRKGEKWIL